MPICGLPRSDGVPCSAEQGHYGTHVWPDLELPIIVVGDSVRIDFVDPNNVTTMLQKVVGIRTEYDGSKLLVLENT
jgi:hypothetical protein